MSTTASPDCIVGKCRACDERALDDTTDEIVECCCYCHGGKP